MVEDDEPIKKLIESTLGNSGLAETRAAKADIDDLLKYGTCINFILSLTDFLDYCPHSMTSAYTSHDLCLSILPNGLINGSLYPTGIEVTLLHCEISRSLP